MRNSAFLPRKRFWFARLPVFQWRRWLSRSFCLLFAVALTLTLCTQLSAQEELKPKPQEWQIRGIEAALADDRPGVWEKALDQLAEYEPQAIQALAKPETVEKIADIFKDKEQDGRTRSIASVALGKVSDAANIYIPDIANILKDPQQDNNARGSAAEALSYFGDAAKSYIPDILDFIKTPQQDTDARIQAARALGNFGNAAEPYIPKILSFIQDSRQDFTVRGYAAEALGNFGDAAKPYVSKILSFVRDSQQDSYVRGRMVLVLGNLGNAAKPYVSDIANIFTDPQQDPYLRSSAAFALSSIESAIEPYIPDIVDILKNSQQDFSLLGGVIGVLGNTGNIAKPYVSDIANILKDPQQNSYVRGKAALALDGLGNATLYIQDLLNILKDPQQFSYVRIWITWVFSNLGDAAKPYISDLLNIIKIPQQDGDVSGQIAYALGRMTKLNLEQIIIVLSRIYGEQISTDEWRFHAYFLSGGDEDVQRLLQWIASPAQLPETLNHEEGVKTLEVFQKAWESAKEFPKLQDDLANKIARVTKLETWQLQDLPLLQQHYNNLKGSHAASADAVQAAINSLQGWRWFVASRNIILTHAAFWLALIFAYPKFPQVQAFFFWNPWMRKILGLGYVGLLLAWVPFLRRKLFQPFKPSLLADARLSDFNPDLYFANSDVQLRGSDTLQPTSTFANLRGQFILEGDSGLGKTMLLRHLLTQTQRIAVYLPATKCSEGVIEAIQKKLHGDEIKDAKFLQSLIYSGAIDIYIDGLNEVSPDTRAKITQFVESHFRGNILMTTQPLEWIAPATAKTYILQPLQPQQIEAYLLSRQPAKTAQRQGENYQQACRAFLNAVLGDQARFASEEQQAVHSILSNPMELTLAAQILADGNQPDLLNLRQQQYNLMAADYQEMWKRTFPLLPFSEAVYQLRLTDKRALPAEEFYNELICMEDEKFRMVISRQWQDAKSEAQKEWYFRHDKIAEFFIVQTFLGNTDEAKTRLQTHIGDPRFRGVYFLLATLLPLDAAQQLREDLINYAADTKDHTVSDTFVQLVRSRKASSVPV